MTCESPKGTFGCDEMASLSSQSTLQFAPTTPMPLLPFALGTIVARKRHILWGEGCFAMASKIHRRRHGRTEFDGNGLMAIRLAFAHKFGRFPRGDDPVFFDPDANRPYSLPSGGTQRLLLEAMLENGTAPQIVYAYCRTGFAVFDKNRTALPPDRLFRWDTAINEYLAFGAKAKHVQH